MPRHTAATLLPLMSVDGRVVMNMMGWSAGFRAQALPNVLDEMKVEAAKQLSDTLWSESASPDPETETAGVASMADFRARRKA